MVVSTQERARLVARYAASIVPEQHLTSGNLPAETVETSPVVPATAENSFTNAAYMLVTVVTSAGKKAFASEAAASPAATHQRSTRALR